MKKLIDFFYVLTIVSAGIVSLLDFYDIFEKVPDLQPEIPALTLLLMTLLSTSLILSTKTIRETLDSINPSVSFSQFESPDETLQYILRQMKRAKQQISDVTIHYPSRATLFMSPKDRVEYAKVVKDMSRKVIYKEIIFFDSKRSDTSGIRRRLKETGKYYDVVGLLDKPYVAPSGATGFVIIDDEIIFTKGLVIKHPLVINYFQNNYDELWATGEKIKTGEYVSTKLLDQIDGEQHRQTD